jgi:hypothetical protein
VVRYVTGDLLAYGCGLLTRAAVDAYVERRRKDRVRAFKVVAEDAGKPVRLSEKLRRQGMYDEPEMFV